MTAAATIRSAEALAEAGARAAGPDAVRLAGEGDAVGGVAPRLLVEPASEAALAATLAWAKAARLRVVVRGGGTKLGWGPPPAAVDLVLSTVHLNALVEHRQGDLTATVQAGAPLTRVNAELARHGQWIPLDPPWAERATIGGIVATDDSGPRRQRHGTPRDLIIGIGMARADGRLARAGGKVVKNVAGYDLSRLLCGSHGALGVITEATFKLAPLPASSRTVAIDLPELSRLGALALALSASQLVPASIELQLPPGRLLVRFESVETAAEAQAAGAAQLASAHGGRSRLAAGAEEAALWQEHAARPWDGAGAVVKLSLLPSDLAETLNWLRGVAAARRIEVEAVGRAGLGVLLVRLDGDVDAQVRLVEWLRERLAPGRGNAVILRGHPDLKARLDVWGPIGDGLALMRAVKRQFDPSGTLNPGRGPGGL